MRLVGIIVLTIGICACVYTFLLVSSGERLCAEWVPYVWGAVAIVGLIIWRTAAKGGKKAIPGD